MRWPVIIGSSVGSSRLRRTRDAHRPGLEEPHLDEVAHDRAHAAERSLARMAARGEDGFDDARNVRGQQALLHNAVRGNHADDRAAGELLPFRDDGREIECGRGRAFERPQQAVEDAAEERRPQPHRQRKAAAGHEVARAQPGGVFIDLGDEGVALEPDDLPRQAVRADLDRLADAEFVPRSRMQDRAADPVNDRR